MAGRFRHKIERLAAVCALGIIPLLPRRAVVLLARAGGWCAAHAARHLRRVALANLEIAFGDSLSMRHKNRLLCSSFQSFALVLLDLFWFSRRSEKRMQEWVEPCPALADVRNDRGPRLCLTMHLGNWELLGRYVARQGVPLASVARPLDNEGLNRLFNGLRRDSGQEIVPRRGALRRLITLLRSGHAVALLLDQNTKPTQGGVFAPFFGIPVPVAASAASLARRTGASIWFATCIADRRGRYRIGSLEQLPLSGNDDRADTARIVKRMEQEVRRHPEHWLWMYKRWKYVPPGYGREKLPFYAKEMAPADVQRVRDSLATRHPTPR